MTTAVPVAHSAHQLPRRADYRLIMDGSQHSHTSVHPGRAGAVGALADYVFELAKERLLDKHDGVDWRNLLKKSAKRLEKGERAEGLALLQAFIREVPAKTGPPVREVLLARGYRALEIVTTP